MNEFIYALVDTDHPTEYLYVGRTNNTHRRLLEHCSQALRRPTTKKDSELGAMLRDRRNIDIIILETVPKGHLNDAEDLYITNHQPRWNSKQGDTHQFRPGKTVSTVPTAPMLDRIKTLEWKRGYKLAKPSEWYASINGVILCRTGWSKLRLKSPGRAWETRGLWGKEDFPTRLEKILNNLEKN